MKLMKTKALAALTLAGVLSAAGSMYALADTTAPNYSGYATYAEYLAAYPEFAPQKINKLWWEGAKVFWNTSANSLQYEVEIYRNDTLYASAVVSGTEYNMGTASYPSGTYTARVRGIGAQSYAGVWSSYTTARYMGGYKKTTATTNTQSTSATRYVPAGMGNVGWNQDADGYWYCNPNMTYTANGWQEIDGKWYYFDDNGRIHKGWLSKDDKWYYITTVGMVTGDATIDDVKYYFDNSTGIMLANAYTPDGRYVDINGVVR